MDNIYDAMREALEARKERSAWGRGVQAYAVDLVDNLDNLESYLSHHFPEWVSRWANSPEDLAAEMEEFARMEI